MTLRPNPGRGVKCISKAARLLGAAAVVATSCAGVQGGSQGAAFAQSPSDETIISNFSWLNVAVRGGSTTPGTDVIQWWANGGGEQQWDNFHYDSNPSVGGASYWGGAEIDGWYPNNQLNQVFSTPGDGNL